MPQNLCDLWHANVQHSPEAIAVIDGETGRAWSRAALDTAADEWLQAQAANSALEDKRVAVAEPNGSRWLAIFIGLLKCRAIAVPLDSAEPSEARIATATAAGASALWSNGELRQLNPRPAARQREYCLIKLTSGSTGTPRALLFTHEQMIADGRQVCASMDIRPDDLNLGIIPFGHSYGLGNLVIPLLVQGTPILACASPLPSSLAADCTRWKPTVFAAVPALLRALLLAEVEPSAIASLRLVVSAGAPLAPDVAKAFKERFGRHIHSFYGSSETGGITYDRTGEAALTGRSVGTPMEGVQLEFKRGGRFAVVSAAVMGKGRHSPPDRAKLNEAGELVLLGRAGRTAKIGGRRIDLGEIENSLRATPGVVDAYAIPHPSRSDALAAAVTGNVDSALVRSVLRARVALWKIPERILVLPEFPRTSRGKIDRKQLDRLLAD